MSKKNNDFYRRVGQGIIAALTCHTKLFVTLFVYAVIALLLLAYVSANVMTGMLTQEITELKRTRHEHNETLNKLTGEYIAKSSRARVVKYCESVLGMVPAEDESFQRYAVRQNEAHLDHDVEFAIDLPPSADLTGYTSLRVNGVTTR